MRVLLQRVSEASVTVDQETTGKIDRGLLLFVGFGLGDTAEKLPKSVQKICSLRLFPDERGRFDRSVEEVGGEILLVSQFTLYGETSKGRRPDFGAALPPSEAEKLYDQMKAMLLEKLGEDRVAAGIFGGDMKVQLVNDGPVTFLLEF